MAVHVGTVLADRFEVTAPIATGGMGEVWRGRDRTLGRAVAIKVLRSEYTGDSSFLIRFRNEARHTAALSHPNIASVYDYGETVVDGHRLAYLVMELVEGKPLVTILAEHGRLTAAQTLDVLAQAGDGLSAAHAAGMVHRDIKPGNLLVRPDGVVKLTDFGIAYARDAAPLTRTGMVVGTAQYLSPEQAQGFVVTAASDVYSLGVLGYECVAGTRPFDGESQVAIALAQINRPPPPMPADVPGPVKALIERALAKDPAARYPDGGAFAAAVRQVAAGGAAPPPTAVTTALTSAGAATSMLPTGTLRADPGTAPRTMPPLQGPPTGGDGGDGAGPGGWDGGDAGRAASRRRLLWVAGALAVLLVLAGTAWGLLSGGEDPDSGDTVGTGSATSAAPTESASTNSTGGIEFDVAGYVGRDVDEVAEQLEGLGLQVDPEEASDAQLAAVGRPLDEDTVVTADPASGTLTQGQEIVLFFTPDAYTPGGDPTDDAEPTTEAPATTAAPTETSEAPAETSTSRPAETSTSRPAETSTSRPADTSTAPPPAPSASATAPSTSPSAEADEQAVVAHPSGTP
ncbi:protein kinase domain-containing protein [Modestobacter marinus]|uniref:protein kinase domain-containing protein n=1 Tax=Modestobacter marinus TaxID=477641 RepID=UPI001C959549|nr:protein kinase [Modestobacter marinus]